MIRIMSVFVTFIFIWISAGYGQQKNPDSRILFRGVVLSSSSGEKLAGSQIVINRKHAAASRYDGTFSFWAERSDTIIFTMLGYKPATLFVSDSLKSREFLTGVYLNADTLEIGEVIILPRFTNLKAEMMNPRVEYNPQMENAKSNISIASYVGRTSQSKMGDPYINYEILRNKQKRASYEKGGIPSDQMVGISPFLLIPAAYLLLHGLPEAPVPPEPGISSKDLDDLNRFYLESLRNRK